MMRSDHLMSRAAIAGSPFFHGIRSAEPIQRSTDYAWLFPAMRRRQRAARLNAHYSFPRAAEVFFDHAIQLARIDGLVQEIVHPRRQALFPHPRLRGGGERDDWDVSGAAVSGFAHGQGGFAGAGLGRWSGVVLPDDR